MLPSDLTTNGPFSVKNPETEEQPGPPFSQSTKSLDELVALVNQ